MIDQTYNFHCPWCDYVSTILYYGGLYHGIRHDCNNNIVVGFMTSTHEEKMFSYVSIDFLSLSGDIIYATTIYLNNPPSFFCENLQLTLDLNMMFLPLDKIRQKLITYALLI
jgi:hypothetical protein